MEEDGTVLRPNNMFTIAIQYICDMLIKVANNQLMDSLRIQFQSLLTTSHTRGVPGVFFKATAHAHMSRTGHHSYTIRNLHSSSNDTIRLNLTDMLVFTNLGDLPPATTRPDRYIRPQRSNFSSFDAFAWDNPPILFQYTISLKHPINLDGLKKLEGVFGDPSDSGQKWRLVFVVPETEADKFEEQRYKSATKYWEPRIDLYVLGLSPDDLWPIRA